MNKAKTSLDNKKIQRLIWLVLTLSVLLGYSLQSAAGTTYYSMLMQAYGTVSSPPVILEEGTAGASTVYTNKTSAKVSVAAPVWLSGWDKRVKITIDNNDVDSALSNFPVLVYLSSSSGRNNDNVTCVFDEVGPNSKKIAVTTSDGTQCYVEIEKWNATGEEAWLWVKVPSISNTSDTDLYLYYDNDHADNTAYVDDASTGVSVNVWEGSFKMVQHMQETDIDGGPGDIKDSTSNGNNGTTSGMDSTDQVAGQIDGSFDFNDTDDYVEVPDSSSLSIPNDVTVEAWVKPTWATYPDRGLVYSDWDDDGGTDNSVRFVLYSGKVSLYISSNGTNYDNLDGDTALDLNQWSYIVATFDSGTFNVYLNGQTDTTEKTSSTVTSIYNSSFTKTIGIKNTPAHDFPFKGTIDEVRISDTSRSAAWIKASYESGRDDLVAYGSEEVGASDYDYVLKVVNQVADNWTVNLQVYDSSNISRLSNTTIGIRNTTTTSNQIIVSGGTITQTEGAFFNLPGGLGSTIYISMSNIQATTTGTSHLYVHLKIQVPDTSTYSLYVITFEIT